MGVEEKDESMNVIEHLGELRKRIIITGISFVILLIVSFIYVGDIYKWFVKDLNVELTVLSPTEILWVYFMLAGVIAIAGTIPVAAWQIWMFVKPGLTNKEQRVTLSYIPALFLLFIGGISFGYFVILPIVLNFLIELSEGHFQTMFTTEKYFQFVLRLTLPFGILFELPVVIMFLTSLGIIDPYKLTKIRKYAYFVLVIISVVISPPDFLSDVLIIIPLLLLYECSIFLSKFVYRRRLKKLKKETYSDYLSGE
ncbi:twin-arginine translocase subunit TatC [Bacillus solimangrovi]|uniref:Sec-independent protein translocase protein TatC n=1 Tax=Bacillus solimangrovi TaxID=1305675 RepID=A0A1E5LFF0_9BACI|nr:twin-arginine translocase subunit TatC [Bacillus solimangrovi]OEH92818.1 twin arginine-targeting protein translocase TatC [Bacillus solimangrovi]